MSHSQSCLVYPSQSDQVNPTQSTLAIKVTTNNKTDYNVINNSHYHHPSTTQYQPVEQVYESEGSIDEINSTKLEQVSLYNNDYNHKIHLYPKLTRKRKLVDPFWKNLPKHCGTCCIIICFYLITIIGGVYTVLWGNNRMDYGDSFNIKGTCICAEECSIPTRCYGSTYSMVDLPVCDGVKEPGYTFWSGPGCKYTGKEVDCYTNKVCRRIFGGTHNKYHVDGGWIYFGASIIFLIAACCCCCCYLPFDSNRDDILHRISCPEGCITDDMYPEAYHKLVNGIKDFCGYYNGSDKRRYYEEYWDERMTSNCFINYYRRKYRFKMSMDIEQLLMDYV